MPGLFCRTDIGVGEIEDFSYPANRVAICATPRPHAWTRPGFRLPSSLRRGCNVCCLPLRLQRGVSRRFNSQCPHALSQTGNRNPTCSRSSFPSTGCNGPPSHHRSQLTRGSYCPGLVTGQQYFHLGHKTFESCDLSQSCRFPLRPTRSLRSLLEVGGSTSNYAESVDVRPLGTMDDTW